MAISSGIISNTAFSSDTLSLLRPSTASFGPLGAPPASVTLRMARTFTTRATAASSKPVAAEAAGRKREPRGIMRPRRVSPEMAEFVGAPEIPRTEVLKLIWAHIKKHNLQDPNNKKIIICDEKLKKLFGGRDQVGFLDIARLITPHFL